MPATLLRSIDELRAVQTEWDALWRRDPRATPFQSPAWLLNWWDRFGGGDVAAVAVRDNDTLTGLTPLYVLRDEDSGESLGMLIGTGISDYLDALGHFDPAPLAGFDCMLWDLQSLRPDSPILTASLDGYSAIDEDQEPCPLLDLRGELGSSHFRKKLRYLHRLAAREGNVSFESATRASLDEYLEALFALHAARWKLRGLPGVLADSTTQDFHRAVAASFLDSGTLRMYAMRIDTRIAAIFYGFAHHTTTYYYLGGYAPDLDRISPGTLIVAHAVEQAQREGHTTFDFLRGAEEYKYSWGATDRINRKRQWIRT
ncbi:MAG TPA: GNAT family N-acetyltransferase [Thermoanaerobaculia bacterium]|nr:GNAT family N-acetyltransferase [Thermoanaerobaculia bacterium]